MYAREIAGTAEEDYQDAQFRCADCEASEHEWIQRGRCTGPLPPQADGTPGLVQLRIDSVKGSTAAYPEKFTTCPMGLLRDDLNHDAVALAGLVSHAAAAEVDKRWPDVPARLYWLVREWRLAEMEKLRAEHQAEHQARMEGLKHRGS